MRTLLLLSLLLPTVALGQARYTSTVTDSSVLLTASAPTGPLEGFDLNTVVAYRWVVAAPSGQTITGGYMDCYYRPSVTAIWTPCIQPSVTLRTGQRFAPSYDYSVGVGQGRLRWIPRAITLSGAGTTVTVYTEVSSR